MNFAALDLNLLRVFDAMMVELNTTRAGERLGLSQPAVSSALGRLRHVIGDDLFLREGNRMVATPRAQALAGPIRETLHRLESALNAALGYDPACSDRVFRLSGSDYFSALLMPGLAAICQEEAPCVTVQMIDHPAAEAVAALAEGTIDVGVEARFALPDWACSRVLYQSQVVTVARYGHPELSAAGLAPGARIPAEVYCRCPHVIMSMDGGRTGTLDRLLAAQGLARHVAMTVPHFHAVALVAAGSSALGSMPGHFARRYGPMLGLEMFLPPVDPPLLDVMMFWHRRHDDDPAHAWLRERIARVMGAVREVPLAAPGGAGPIPVGAGALPGEAQADAAALVSYLPPQGPTGPC